MMQRMSRTQLGLIVALPVIFGISVLAKEMTSKRVAPTTLQEVSVPRDQEVCFSLVEPCDLKLIKFMQSARKSLDIAIYDINRDQLVHSILVISKKVPVRVI